MTRWSSMDVSVIANKTEPAALLIHAEVLWEVHNYSSPSLLPVLWKATSLQIRYGHAACFGPSSAEGAGHF
jgi:hypothetical protein